MSVLPCRQPLLQQVLPSFPLLQAAGIWVYCFLYLVSPTWSWPQRAVSFPYPGTVVSGPMQGTQRTQRHSFISRQQGWLRQLAMTATVTADPGLSALALGCGIGIQEGDSGLDAGGL